MKKHLLILLIFLPNLLFAQNKFNIDFSSGIIVYKGYAGYNFDLGASFNASKRVSVYGNYNFSELYLKNAVKSDFHRFQSGVYYNFLNGDTQISSIIGYSIIFTDNNFIFDRKTTAAFDLGVLCLFNADERFTYGMKWVNTYCVSANGGIMQMNLFCQFKL